ncbi:TadE family type IV pilus minor pilin [Cellulosimicrobium cellulans]
MRRDAGAENRRLRGRVRQGGERGAVTAELAVALPAVVLVLVVVLTLAAAAGAQMRSADAARAAARAVAIGEDDATALRVAGADATVGVLRGDPWVEVHVTTPVVGGWLAGSPLRASGAAVAWAEP